MTLFDKIFLSFWQLWVLFISILYFRDKIEFELAVIFCLMAISSMIVSVSREVKRK